MNNFFHCAIPPDDESKLFALIDLANEHVYTTTACVVCDDDYDDECSQELFILYNGVMLPIHWTKRFGQSIKHFRQTAKKYTEK